MSDYTERRSNAEDKVTAFRVWVQGEVTRQLDIVQRTQRFHFSDSLGCGRLTFPVRREDAWMASAFSGNSCDDVRCYGMYVYSDRVNVHHGDPSEWAPLPPLVEDVEETVPETEEVEEKMVEMRTEVEEETVWGKIWTKLCMGLL